MNKIGILAGGGKLPLIIGKNLMKYNHEVYFFCIEKFANKIMYKNCNYETISINSLSKILQRLKINKIDKIIMAGYVQRPSIKDIKFDINALKLIKDYALASKGDDDLLFTISNFFKKRGFPIFNWKDKCKDLFVRDENITKQKPSREAINNKKKGLAIYKFIGKGDIGQSLIIQNNIILGIEAAEGTDELVKRCFKYKKKGDGGILLKLSKYKQNKNLDIPVIGLNTIRNIKKYKYEGIFLEKNKCIVIDKKKVINFCNLNNIFISSVDKVD